MCYTWLCCYTQLHQPICLQCSTTTQSKVTYADAGFKLDEKSGRPQTGYIFLKNNAPISWKSVKHIVTATSTNHSELIAFHEATREAVWLRTTHKIITEQSGLTQDNKPIVIFEDNVACVAQVGVGFIKIDRVKHICPQIFGFTQDLIQSGMIEVNTYGPSTVIVSLFIVS
jgi:hypothetical protein